MSRYSRATGNAWVMFVANTSGAAWCFSHAYEGQPMAEGLAPLALCWLLAFAVMTLLWLSVG